MSLAKVDLLYYPHALKRRGLFENVETTMKEATARQLDVGSRVTWDKNPKDAGTVIEKGYNAVKVKWDDPSNGDVSLLHFTEMANIGLLPANRQYPAGHVSDVSLSM